MGFSGYDSEAADSARARRTRMTGIIATTHVAADGLALAKSALEDLVEQINARPWPSNVEHDPTNPPVGRVVSASLEHLEDGEWAVRAEMELFDTGHPVMLIPEGGLTADAVDVPPVPGPIEINTDERNFPDANALHRLTEAVETAGEIEVDSNLVRRSLLPDPLLVFGLGSVGTAMFWFSKGFFSKAGERLGDAVGEDLVAQYQKLKESVSGLLATRVPADRAPILLITVVVDVDGSPVEVEGSFRGDEPRDVGEFLDAGEALVAVGSGLAHTLPNRDRLRKLHFSFDVERGGWVAVYGLTEDAEGFTFGQLMPPGAPGSTAPSE